MIWWGIIVFALAGWLASEFETFGLMLGALFGWAAGTALQRAVRKEIETSVRRHLLEHNWHQDIADENSQVPASPWEREAEVVPSAPPAPEPEPAETPTSAVIKLGRREAALEDHPAEFARAASYTPEPTNLWVTKARDWLLGGNTIVRLGLVILFVGLSFLVRYAANAGLFPIELRLAAVGAAGAAMVAVGFNRRAIKPDFALAVQGAGVGVLYLTVFAAARIYTLLPPIPAFGLMAIFCALGCALALLQNSQGLALAAFAGGFAVPVLLGGEAETPLGLFSYGTILNLAILFIAWKRSWRILNLLGFFATFGLATLWGMDAYEPRHYMVCQIFLAISVLIYVGAAVLYAHNTPGKLGNAADSTLLFGPAFAGFGLQAGLVQNFEYGSALAALAFGAGYVGFALLCLRKRRDEMRVLIESLGAIGIGFATLAIPLALDAKWTSSAWALEGAGAFWIGMRQARWMQRLFGLLLIAVAVLIFVVTLEPNVSGVPLLNGGFIGALLVAAPLIAVAWWLRKPLPHSGTALALNYAGAEFGSRQLVFLGGFALTCIAMVLEITRVLPAQVAGEWGEPVLSVNLQRLSLMLAVLAAMAISAWQGRKHSWSVAGWPGQISLFVLGTGLLAQIADGRNVLYLPDLAFWAAALALHLHLLRESDRDSAGGMAWRGVLHAGTVWLGCGMLANALYLGIERGALWNTSWAGVIHLVSVTAVLSALTLWAGRHAGAEHAGLRWPLDPHARSYYWTAAVPLALLTFGGALFTAILAQGVTDPLPYIPIVNPVDLSVALALLALVAWRKMVGRIEPRPAAASLVLDSAALAGWAGAWFILVNTIWLRTAHHLLGVDWNASALMDSFVVQTGLAILWTLLALALTITAHRRGLRIVWLAGAALLGMVVAKLLLVDMSNSDSWERVVAFIGVGVLMLVIGYFVPMPPRESDTQEVKP